MYDRIKAIEAQKAYCDQHDAPNFAGEGYCYHCGRDVYGEGGYTVEDAQNRLITRCPWCNTSFCE